jgi:hypothetical protein
MTITFSIFKKSYADNLNDEDFQTALKTDLDALNASTVYSINIEHLNGFWVIVAIFSAT